jgi:hypothetical protein
VLLRSVPENLSPQVRGINSIKRALQTFTKPIVLDKDNKYRYYAICCDDCENNLLASHHIRKLAAFK